MFSLCRDNGARCGLRACPRRFAGMIMVELMVALAVAGVLLVGIYQIYSISSGTYRTQDEVINAMNQARFGFEQLRRDISAAAFQATPDSAADPNVCPKPANPVRSVIFERAGDVANPGENVNIQPNGVILFGAFWSPEVFHTDSVVGNVVTLQTAAASAPYPQTAGEFDAIFVPGRYLRLVNAEQNEGYYQIQAASFATGQIQLATAVAVASAPSYCGVQGFGVGLDATVAGFIRYRMVTDPDDGTGAKIDLVRQEMSPLDPTLQTVTPNTTVRIAENVVDLQFYDFIVDSDRSGSAPLMANLPNIAAVLDGGAQKLDNTTDARPQDLRFVTVKLTTRTEHEDEELPHVQRPALFAPIETYEVDPGMAGSARTVTLAGRVGIKSLEVRNVK